MKEKILLFFKGMILGFAMIIPGLSGGVLAISMGIYEKIVKTISHFFKDFKENLKFCINLGLGAGVSLVISVLILNYTFEHFPLPSTLFFIGLILGSVPALFKKVEIKKTISVSNIIFITLGAFIILCVRLFGYSQEAVLESFNIIQAVKLLGVGVISAATIVVPGISGSLVLMVIGYYQPLLNVISETIKFNNLGFNLTILIPFGIGMVIGVLMLVKIIEYLLNKHENKTYYAILGFLFASIFQIVFTLFSYNTTIIQTIIGVVLLIVGAFLSLKVFKND